MRLEKRFKRFYKIRREVEQPGGELTGNKTKDFPCKFKMTYILRSPVCEHVKRAVHGYDTGIAE